MYNNPIAYFITFTTCGAWLHGDPRGSVMRVNGGSKRLDDQPNFYAYHQTQLSSPPVILEAAQRQVVRDTIIKHCDVRHWRPYALHVRTNHVHVVVNADKPIEQVSKELKGWPKRVLGDHGFKPPKVWTGGSSKVFIFTEAKLREKIHYVVYEQGEMMAYYVDEAYG